MRQPSKIDETIAAPEGFLGNASADSRIAAPIRLN